MSTFFQNRWTEIWPFAASFGIGLLAMVVLYRIVRFMVRLLRRKGGTAREATAEGEIGLAATFACIEQFLFYLAAIAGSNVFGFAVAGWLVFKGVSHYARWTPEAVSAQVTPPEDSKLTPEHYAAAIARNRFVIFVIGTGMAVAAGGVAGAVYHYAASLMP